MEELSVYFRGLRAGNYVILLSVKSKSGER